MTQAIDQESWEATRPRWHPNLMRLYEYWRSIHPAGGGLPGRQHLDPMEIPELLPSIWMLDVQREPFRLRYRLVGTRIEEVRGHKLTGSWLDESSPEIVNFESYYRRYRDAVETGQPRWRRGRGQMQHLRDIDELENILLPLAADGKTVDLLLCKTIYYDRFGRTLL
jgi:hypothetical protein